MTHLYKDRTTEATFKNVNLLQHMKYSTFIPQLLDVLYNSKKLNIC